MRLQRRAGTEEAAGGHSTQHEQQEGAPHGNTGLDGAGAVPGSAWYCGMLLLRCAPPSSNYSILGREEEAGRRSTQHELWGVLC